MTMFPAPSLLPFIRCQQIVYNIPIRGTRLCPIPNNNQARHPLAKFHRRPKRLSCEYSMPLECALGDHPDGLSCFTDKFCSLRVMKVALAATSQSLGALMAEMTIKQPDLELTRPNPIRSPFPLPRRPLCRSARHSRILIQRTCHK